jgi:thiamine biosynthesis protein ThiI
MRLLALVSGGIDSPVAVHLLQQAGHQVDVVHFEMGRFAAWEEGHSMEGPSRVEGHLRILAKLAGRELRLFEVENEPALELIVSKGGKLACVLCKRNMVRVAGAIAMENGYGALAMGDSLGQVASQTMDNIRTVEGATPIPIVRPLIGLDKSEIMAIAKAIGTYAISVGDAPVCKALPTMPATRADPARAEAVEEGLGWLEGPPKLVIRERIISPGP